MALIIHRVNPTDRAKPHQSRVLRVFGTWHELGLSAVSPKRFPDLLAKGREGACHSWEVTGLDHC